AGRPPVLPPSRTAAGRSRAAVDQDATSRSPFAKSHVYYLEPPSPFDQQAQPQDQSVAYQGPLPWLTVRGAGRPTAARHLILGPHPPLAPGSARRRRPAPRPPARPGLPCFLQERFTMLTDSSLEGCRPLSQGVS